MTILKYTFTLLAGYLIGCFNISYIFGKLKGIDIRKTGTRNAGATNTLLTLGKKFGVITLISDVLKSALAFQLGRWILGSDSFGFLASSACITGHIFPITLHWHGGRGSAAFAGMVLAYDWQVFLLMVAILLLLIFISKYGVFSICCTLLIFFGHQFFVHQPPLTLVCIGFSIVLVFFKHRAAISRTFRGTEPRISDHKRAANE